MDKKDGAASIYFAECAAAPKGITFQTGKKGRDNYTMKPRQRACRYVRKSRDDGQGETLEETLARHIRITDSMAADRGLEITETYQEVVSGASISERPEMMRLLDDIKDGRWDIVIVVDISRLSRGDGSDQAIISNAFRLTGTKCLSDWKIYDLDDQDDLDLFEGKLQNSRIEYKAITKRMTRGVKNSVSEGYRCAVAPYGLRLVGAKRHYTLERSEFFKNYLMAMEYWHDNPNPTWHNLQKLFHDRGILSPKGNEWWSIPALEYMVLNDVYLGYSIWGVHKTESYLGDDFSERKRTVISDKPIRVEAAWQPFIDREYAAEARMRIRRMPPTEKKITNPLAGLLRCSKCGYAMGRRMYKDSGRAYFIHADWSNGTRGGCDCKSVRTDIIMDMLVDSLKATMKDQVVALDSGGAKERIAKLEADIENMRGEIERSRKSLVDAYYRLDRGVIDEVTYKRVSQIENERIERLEDSIEKARREIAATDSDKIEARIVSLREMLAALNDGSLPADKVNIILKQFIDRIEYTNYAPPRTRKNDIRLDVFLLS